MQKRSRIRRILKWTGIVTCAVTLLAMTVSLFVWNMLDITTRSGTTVIVLQDGCIHLFTIPVASKKLEFYWRRFHPPSFASAWYWFAEWKPDRFYVIVPLYPVVLLGMLIGFVYIRRLPAPGHCQRCGYDLTGNISGVCPECGMAVRCGAETNDTTGEPVKGDQET